MKRIRKILSFLPGLLLLFSCTVEERYNITPGGGNVTEESKEVTLNFMVKVPGQSAPATSTRAMGELGENYVESIDVLVFEVDSVSKDETYLYRVQGKNLSDRNTAGSEKSFDVTLIKQEGKEYRLVVLANASREINALEPIAEGAVKEELVRRLKYQNSSQWNSTSTQQFDPIPMWAESKITPITDDMRISDLRFLRMVSRLDIALNDTITNFRLNSVRFYNRHQVGYIVPFMSDTVYTDPEAGSLKVVKAPDSLIHFEKIREPEYAYSASGDTACIGEIYLMESLAGTTLSDASCVVVGGFYDGLNTETFYRLDFLEADKVTFKDILRNHRYRFTIHSVKGAGHGSAGEAFNARSINMEASIFDWDESDMSEVVFDGQYMLSVSQGEFQLPRDERKDSLDQNRLMIYTDYDVEPNAGWKIDKIVDELGEDISGVWLSVDSWSGSAGVKTPVYLLLEENEGAGFRVGYIHISAGRLNFMVKVEQTDEPEISLAVYEILADGSRVEVTELVFSAHANSITPREFVVEWAPARGDFLVSESEIGNTGLGFAYNEIGGSDRVEVGSLNYPGYYSCTLFPAEMTPAETDPLQGGHVFLEKSSRIDFTINNGVSYLTKSLYLRQVNYGLTYEKDNIYLMDGKEHRICVKSNTTWKAEVWRDTANVITDLKTLSGGNSIATGQEVRFELTDDVSQPEIFQATAELLFTTARFDSVFVEIRCASGIPQKLSNSYIVKPGGVGILIPVSRANEFTSLVGTSDAITDAFNGELLWTDNSKGIADDSNIKLITESGTGSSGHILILPGTGEGNALVAVTVEGEIKWSWHIWVIDYDPVSDHTLNGNHFMDRNLGATSAIDEGNSMGLLYQWGRKDPFPGGARLTFYDASGTPKSLPLFTQVSGGIHLSLSIANPTTFYEATTYNEYDWYSGTTNHNDNLWGSSGLKTIYDPCPVGWRVPSFNGSTSPWEGLRNSNFPWSVSGRIHDGSYYPAGGTRSCSTGVIFSPPGMYGYYWSASPYGTSSYCLRFTESSTEIAPNHYLYPCVRSLCTLRARIVTCSEVKK